jgi:hypothetical protein
MLIHCGNHGVIREAGEMMGSELNKESEGRR